MYNQQEFAKEILQLSRNQLLIHFRFLANAVSRLELTESESVRFACDGRRILYAPRAILQYYKNDKNYINRMYLHCMFHCMMQHMYAGKNYQGLYWNLACDIAVEQMILNLHQSYLATHRDGAQRATLEILKDKLPAMNAELIYHHFVNNPPTDGDMEALIASFEIDDHTGWCSSGQSQSSDETDADSKKESQDMENDIDKDSWEKIARRALVELENFQRDSDMDMEAMIQQLKMVTRTRQDYRRFLQKFFTMGETMQLNMEEFDNIFYTYGLKLYGNVPLIEPLEYKEDKRIRDFAIVIDTSASVSGDMVQGFLQKTYDILMQSENFFSKINLYLIQCDSKIQEAVKLTSKEQIQEYIDHMEIKGLGRTDFRPAFQYIDELVLSGELKNLKGMLYFTDGEGIFPGKRPKYETAFVFLDNYKDVPMVPPWAMKIILNHKDLQ
ncbi:MAG: metallopeptidase [Eubacterium sp.]|nr:metallopeptidase [Eubacterium sp.]